jgi:hypothetical protein
MASDAKLLTIEFLKWVASRPRTDAEAREAWRSTCPLTCAWEDAVSDGLVQYERAASAGPARLVLTPQGRALVERASAPAAISLDRPAASR